MASALLRATECVGRLRLLDLSLVEQLAWYELGGEAEETAVECADRSQAAGVLRCTQNDTLFLRGREQRQLQMER
jgi:hypothetical protein